MPLQPPEATNQPVRIELVVNGERVTADIEPETLLLDFLREQLHLRGAKRSCDVQVCGSCTVLVEGRAVSACSFLAQETHGREVLTIEGLTRLPEFPEFASALARRGAVQCGFCTPGILLTFKALREEESEPDVEAIQRALQGNICRCTGYRAILAAAHDVFIDAATGHEP